MKRALIIFMIFILVFVSCLLCLCNLSKSDIRTATIEELVELDDIGEALSGRILAHLEANKTCTVDDLISIKGIGEQRLKEIKKHYY